MPKSPLRRGPIPLYAQVKDLIRHRLSSGEGDDVRLPSERELARELGVSRMTVRQATRELADEGAIYTAPGRGMFRAVPQVTQPLGALTSFSEDMRQRGLVPSSRILSEECVTDPAVAARLGVGADDPIARIRRLRLANGEPMAIETANVPLELCPGLLALDLSETSLYDVLRTVFKLRLQSAEQLIGCRVADAATAELLGVDESAPVLHLVRRTMLDDGRFVEYVRALYRGDRYEFRTRLIMQ